VFGKRQLKIDSERGSGRDFRRVTASTSIFLNSENQRTIAGTNFVNSLCGTSFSLLKRKTSQQLLMFMKIIKRLLF
jgi:hypothetical protein